MFETIKKRSDFIRVKKNKAHIVTKSVIVQSCPQDIALPYPRIGLTVTRKVGNAVIRNRIKRRFRSAITSIIDDKKSQFLLEDSTDYVFIARYNAIDRPFDGLAKDIKYALYELQKLDKSQYKK